ncbi:hypothetical protein EON81_27355 [bacterium]|nr:MAG: hypothetical protein EON81_27355 [bacterium]
MIDPNLHERLLRKIRTRERFESDLRKEFGGEPGLKESLARLREQGFINDRRAAEELIRSKSPASRNLLALLLEEKGIDSAQLLADHDDRAAAMQIIEKRKGEPVGRVARYLASKGFDEDLIESVLEDRE